jgi:hypothetical protein
MHVPCQKPFEKLSPYHWSCKHFVVSAHKKNHIQCERNLCLCAERLLHPCPLPLISSIITLTITGFNVHCLWNVLCQSVLSLLELHTHTHTHPPTFSWSSNLSKYCIYFSYVRPQFIDRSSIALNWPSRIPCSIHLFTLYEIVSCFLFYHIMFMKQTLPFIAVKTTAWKNWQLQLR